LVVTLKIDQIQLSLGDFHHLHKSGVFI